MAVFLDQTGPNFCQAEGRQAGLCHPDGGRLDAGFWTSFCLILFSVNLICIKLLITINSCILCVKQYSYSHEIVLILLFSYKYCIYIFTYSWVLSGSSCYPGYDYRYMLCIYKTRYYDEYIYFFLTANCTIVTYFIKTEAKLIFVYYIMYSFSLVDNINLLELLL